jgi:hypothetical protein
VDEELWHGTSEKSKVSPIPAPVMDSPLHTNAERQQHMALNQTFENEPLSGDTSYFECLSLEVWGFN